MRGRGVLLRYGVYERRKRRARGGTTIKLAELNRGGGAENET